MSGLLNILAASDPSPAATTSSYMPSVRVEIAWNAGYLTPAALRTWTDVSDYVELGEGITITGGRGDERSTADANHLTLTFDNSDGRFTFGKTSGPYGSSVKLGRPIRVIADPVDGVETVRFLGFIDELPTEWSEDADVYARAVVTATSRLARLGTQVALKSVVETAILADGPAAYYTLGEPTGSTKANDSSGNRADPLILAGDSAAPMVFGNAVGPTTDGTTAAAFSAVNGAIQYLSNQLTTTSANITIESAFLVPVTASTGAYLFSLYNASNALVVTVDSTGILTGRSASGSVTAGTAASLGATHHVALTVNGTTWTLYLDGVSVGSAAVTGVPAALYTLAVGSAYASSVILPIGTSNACTLAHFALWNSVLSGAQIASHSASELTGYAGETTSARLIRYAGYAGVEAAAIAAETGQTTVQHIDTTGQRAVDLMRVMETTEGGVLYDERDGTTVLHNRAHRLTAASAFTLNMAQQTVESGYAPKADRSAVANDITAADVSGQFTAHVFDATSQTDNGVATMSIETASQDDDEPLNLASWALGKYKDVRERVPSLMVNALAQVGKTPSCAAVMAATVGTKITISNRPTSAASSSVDYFVEGGTEVYGLESLFVTWNLSPSSPEDQTLILGDPVRGFLGVNPLAL